MSEAIFQKKVVAWLRSRGCWVMKTRPGMGTPAGTADIFFCKEGFYGWLECKASRTSSYRPGQKLFLEKMSDWSFAMAVYPENFEEVKKVLIPLLV